MPSERGRLRRAAAPRRRRQVALPSLERIEALYRRGRAFTSGEACAAAQGAPPCRFFPPAATAAAATAAAEVARRRLAQPLASVSRFFTPGPAREAPSLRIGALLRPP